MKTDNFETRLSILRPVLVKFSWRFVTNSSDASDLVQETLLRALRYRSRFKDDKNLQGWLFIIMRNTFINQYRRAKNEKGFVALDAIQPMNRYDVNHNADAKLYTTELMHIVNSINVELRQAFLMHVSGYKYDEIAQHMGVPLGTVKSRIFLARQELQKRLPSYN